MLEITFLILYPGPKEGLQHIQVNFCSDRSSKKKGPIIPHGDMAAQTVTPGNLPPSQLSLLGYSQPSRHNCVC